MAGSHASLEALRREIDEIDSTLQQLLARRSEISKRIGDAKSKGAGVMMRPAREAEVLRRLVDTARRGLPKAVLVRIWREIFAASLAQQGDFSVAVLAEEAGNGLRDLARENFGVCTPISELGSAVRVINAVAAGEASIGVLPALDADSQDPWWRYLARDAAGTPRIIARLPFAAAASPSAQGGLSALVIGLSDLEESGSDRSFLSVEAGEQVSRSAFKDLLVRIGMAVRETAIWQEGPQTWLHLAEVEGFVARKDPRLADLRRLGGDKLRALWVVGAYPQPLSDAQMAEPTGKKSPSAATS